MKYIKIFLIFSIFFFGFRFYAHAARIYFDPQETTVGTSSPFLVGIFIDSDQSINTFSVSVSLPHNMTLLDFSDGDSIINYWVDKPIYDDNTKTLYFSGIVPGGFVGTGARLGLMKIRADGVGVGEIGFNKSETYAIKNSQDGDKLPLSLRSTQISVVKGRENINNIIDDFIPPDPFKPEIARIPDMNSPAYALFEAKDKQSGIDHYEIAESKNKTNNFNKLSWTIVESPSKLVDQSLKSFVYIKAVDKNGNERVEVLNIFGDNSWTLHWFGYIIISIVLILLLRKIFYGIFKNK